MRFVYVWGGGVFLRFKFKLGSFFIGIYRGGPSSSQKIWPRGWGLEGGGGDRRGTLGEVDVLGVEGGRAGVFISIHVLYGSDLLFMYTILNRVRAHP